MKGLKVQAGHTIDLLSRLTAFRTVHASDRFRKKVMQPTGIYVCNKGIDGICGLY